MSNSGGDQARLEQRVTELETLLTHLQRTVHELDEVVREQAARLDALERAQARQRDELRELSAAVVEPRRLEDEKPPHY